MHKIRVSFEIVGKCARVGFARGRSVSRVVDVSPRLGVQKAIFAAQKLILAKELANPRNSHLKKDGMRLVFREWESVKGNVAA